MISSREFMWIVILGMLLSVGIMVIWITIDISETWKRQRQEQVSTDQHSVYMKAKIDNVLKKQLGRES